MASQIVAIKLTDNTTVMARVAGAGGRAKKSLSKGPMPSGDDVVTVLKRVAEASNAALAGVKPGKMTVEVGLELTATSGVIIASGSGTGHLTVTLEWAGPSAG